MVLLKNIVSKRLFFLCRVEGFSNKKDVTIFNPARDFIKLNRTVRRAAKLEDNEELNPIIIEGPVLKVEVIAVYK